MMRTAAWGIDLGTTNSCIARASASAVEIVPIDEAPTVPSVLAWNGSEFLVGRRAANHAVLAPDQAVRSIKRHIGDAGFRATLGGAELTPIEISARILEYLKAQAELATGEAVEEAVITVPAWFNEPQRRATVAAGERAGLKVTRIINEPTAAGLAYGAGASAANVPPREGAERWVVYDLGGGTFDVSILSVSGDYKEVLASCGNTFLGGDDFDHRMVLRWIDRLRDLHNADVSHDRLATAQLRHLAEQTKIRLSSEVAVPVQAFIENGGKRLELDEVLTRAQLAEMIEDYVESTLAKVRQALEEAQIAARDVSRVLLVGGSTKIPYIQERVAQELGIEPEAYVDADLSVALGAAIQSSLDHGLSAAQIVVDIAPQPLGIAVLGDEDRAALTALLETLDEDAGEESDAASYPRTFAPVIRKNARLPAKFIEEFCTVYDGQDGVDVVVLQGESSDTRENTLIGKFHAPFEPKPAGTPIQVGFEYDRNGLVRVSVIDQGGTKVLKSHILDLSLSAESNSEAGALRRHDPAALEDEDDDDWAADAAQPALTNFLVEQVERRLAEVPAAEAQDIRAELACYRELLAAGRDDEIDEVEERLYAWVDGDEPPGAGV